MIGTPQDAIAQITAPTSNRAASAPTCLIGHDWADPAATVRSFELFARLVAPEFRGALDSLRRTRRRSSERFQPLRDKQAAAIESARARYESQRGARSTDRR